MRGAQGDRNRKLNLVLNEYEFAVERIRDLYGAALTKDKLKSTQRIHESNSKTNLSIGEHAT